jgi:hypothetical protein
MKVKPGFAARNSWKLLSSSLARTLANLGNAVKAFLNTQVMGSLLDLRAGETEVPSSAYAHNGDTPGNSWFLLVSPSITGSLL